MLYMNRLNKSYHNPENLRVHVYALHLSPNLGLGIGTWRLTEEQSKLIKLETGFLPLLVSDELSHT